MKRRHFASELADRIVRDSVAFHLKPVDTDRLARDAGFVQGLQAAKDLYEEIDKHNRQEDDE